MEEKKKEIYHSTILVTYNHEDYITDALESILAQETEYGFEVVVVDDCSSDKTSDIVQTYKEKYPEIIRHYRSPENVKNGRLATFNLRPIIRGRYWSILEGDDFWTDKEKLQKQISFLETNPDYIGSTSAYTLYNVQNETKDTHKAGLSEWSIEEMVSGRYALYSHTSTWVWRHIFKAVNDDGFHLHPELKKEYTFGDTCLGYFMAMQGGKIKCFDEPMTCYRMTGKGLWSQLSPEEQAKRNEELYKNIDKITNYKFSKQLDDQTRLLGLKTKILCMLKDKTPFLYKVYLKISNHPLFKRVINKIKQILL